MFSTLPIELQKQILSHVYTHDAIYASMMCKSWSIMCDEIYRECIPENNCTGAHILILNKNSHALKLYLRNNIINSAPTHITLNCNCLNLLGSTFLIEKEASKVHFEFCNACDILKQCLKTNNVLKPYIVKKLVCYVMKEAFNVYNTCNIFMGICIQNKSYDIAKYLLCYFDPNNISVNTVWELSENNVGDFLKYYKFLIDNHAVNLPCLYDKLYVLRNFEYIQELMNFLEKYMDKDVVDMING
jgi:hypothetical protein